MNLKNKVKKNISVHFKKGESLFTFYLSKSVGADSDTRSGSEGLGVVEGSSLSPLRLSN